VIVSDLVPLRYRGNYIAIILLIYSIGTTAGALVGGVIVDNTSWRWVFWINLPIGGLSLIIIILFLNVHHQNHNTSWLTRLKSIDLIGNAILISGSVSMLIALTYAGTRYPWSSWQTLVPLLLGFSAFILFFLFEASRFAPPEPVMPPRLFATRTSIIIAINTFLFTAVIYWAIFFLPVYFQAVQLASPTRAGINTIPVSLLGIPAAAAAAAAVSRWGRYKAIHLVGFTLFTLGLGLFSRLDETSPTAEWVGYMFTGPIGGGLLLNTQLPAFQAPVDEADQAAATGSWYFIRTLGGVWGVAIPAAIFANRVDGLVATGAVGNPVAAGLMVGGGAYQYASARFVELFPAGDQVEIQAVYRLAIQRVFLVGVAFSGVAWLLCLFEKDIPLRTELVTDYGLKEKNETLWAKSKQGGDVVQSGEESGESRQEVVLEER
jgi:MFS family permease